ncbi:hypothetical protein AUC47_06900 [Microbacterium sp. SZ1]|nr:hypothetical protein AUC47_06900 [Microbacterium sp. SZ1]
MKAVRIEECVGSRDLMVQHSYMFGVHHCVRAGSGCAEPVGELRPARTAGSCLFPMCTIVCRPEVIVFGSARDQQRGASRIGHHLSAQLHQPSS